MSQCYKNTDNFVDWTDKWLMKLNAPKCKVMSFNHRRYTSSSVPTKYIINGTELEKSRNYERPGCML